jgi:uncharacterized DUF497 family protein
VKKGNWGIGTVAPAQFNSVPPEGRIRAELSSTSEFDWDEDNRRHIKRHGVEPEEAEPALANDPLDLESWFSESEERFPSVGPTNSGRWLFVVTAAGIESASSHCV